MIVDNKNLKRQTNAKNEEGFYNFSQWPCLNIVDNNKVVSLKIEKHVVNCVDPNI